MQRLAYNRNLDEQLPKTQELKAHMLETLRQQLSIGLPTGDLRKTLEKLGEQLRKGHLIVKAFLRYPLHAKLYLIEREDAIAPLIGLVGSSNLTPAGLEHQGELNVDVLEQDASQKLLSWFEERWQDSHALDITQEFADAIQNSWVGQRNVLPYHLYLKVAYHLSEDARVSETQKLPPPLNEELLPFQKSAVNLALRKLERHGGMLLGDVVGLGKTLMATAIACARWTSHGEVPLVPCPANLVSMWETYLHRYQIPGRVLPYGKFKDLGKWGPYKLIIIDESHNFISRESKRYQAIQQYIRRCGARVVLLSATPFSKHFADLANQLRLFLDEKRDLVIRPERFF